MLGAIKQSSTFIGKFLWESVTLTELNNYVATNIKRRLKQCREPAISIWHFCLTNLCLNQVLYIFRKGAKFIEIDFSPGFTACRCVSFTTDAHFRDVMSP
jgi:hypothetical protein